jgi:hypothetical protein
MSYSRINRNRNYFHIQKEQHKQFMFSIHRARVTDVYVDKGTVNVELEDVAYSAEVDMPFLGMSMPPKKNEDDLAELSASWGRYIPQQGDILLVGFGANGICYALGYNVVYYEGFTQKDLGRTDLGGIGWGEGSAKKLKPGDWDFKSAQGSSLYLGDKVRINSGPHNITVNKSTGDITCKSSLLKDRYGTSSEGRKGEVRRKLLPTDPSETAIYNLALQVAQESTDVVKLGFPQIEMARTQMGDVIDETLFQPMASTLGGTVIRRLESVKDPTGLVDLYVKKVDNAGNYGVEAPTAVMFQWTTPAATWTIANNVTNITTTTSFDITSPLITLRAATGAVIDSINVQLGSAAAADSAVKGVTLMNLLNANFSTAAASLSAAADPASTMAAVKNLGLALTNFLLAFSNVLSLKVKVE